MIMGALTRLAFSAVIIAPGVVADDSKDAWAALAAFVGLKGIQYVAKVATFLPLIPLQRFGSVEDVASVVNFLCTEEHMYIHGQVIGINGGLVI